MHQTRVENVLSNIVMLYSGVVQGSGIGPLMFLVYINELIDVLERHNVKVKMFADDVKMYMKIINDVDLAQLQCALNSLAEWAHQWQLAISIDKQAHREGGVAGTSAPGPGGSKGARAPSKKFKLM